MIQSDTERASLGLRSPGQGNAAGQGECSKCVKCRFYFGDRQMSEGEGECRRHAPSPDAYLFKQLLWMFSSTHDAYLGCETSGEEVDPDGDRVREVDWPVVHSFQGCGEFELFVEAIGTVA